MALKGKSRNTLFGAFCVTGATLMWAAVPICAKISMKSLDAYTTCWLRFAVGSPILFLIAWRRGTLHIPKGRDAWLILFAAIGIGWNYVLYILGLKYTTASAGNVIVEFEFIWLLVFCLLWLKERLDGPKIAGMLLTFAGVLLAIWDGQSLKHFEALLQSEYFFGNVLILIGSPLWAVYGIAQKILADRRVSIITSLAYIFGIAAIITSPTLFWFNLHGPITVGTGVSLVVLVVFGTVASYLLLGIGMKHLDASTAGVITCLLPIFTIAAAWLFLGESLSLAVAAGAAFVVMGIGIIGHAEAKSGDIVPN